MSSEIRRKLTTILAADAAGYSRAMDIDEVGTLGALRQARSVFSRFIERHHGRIVNTAGDGLLAEFPSVVEAVQCAVEVQNELGSHDHEGANSLRFRIGIHLGDVMIDGSDLLGEGVNLAARLQTMAEPGGVLISRPVFDQVHHKLSIGFEYLGEKRPKNFLEDISVYRLDIGGKPHSDEWQAAAAQSTRHERDANTDSGTGNVAETVTFNDESRNRRTVTGAKADNRQVIIRRRARFFGSVALALIVIDVTTGSPFWAHWPVLALGTLLALQLAPLYASGWFNLQYTRSVVIIGALVMVNLFTWTGYPWVLWPAGVIIIIALWRQSRAPSH